MKPTINVPAWITRDFIRAHKHEYIFLYSCPVNLNKVTGQMAEILIDCCYPVPVRDKMCKSSGYWSDQTYGDNIILIHDWLEDVPKNTGKPIIPFPYIGSGGSRLKEFAPQTFKYLREAIMRIAYPNIVYFVGGTSNITSDSVIDINKL